MQRRLFTHTAAAVIVSAATPMQVMAQLKKPEAGREFQVLENPAPTEAGQGKIEVVEFFWYNCPHCNAFEPALAAWVSKLPKDVQFRRAPVAFNASFVPQQKLYFTLEALGLIDKLHGAVFTAIHVQKLKLETPEVILDWAVKNGADKTKFAAAYNSFGVETKAKKASQLQEAYRVEGVPALGVAGRFYSDGGMAGSMDSCLRVADFLLAEVRAKNGSAKRLPAKI